jgi:hypothetical protein
MHTYIDKLRARYYAVVSGAWLALSLPACVLPRVAEQSQQTSSPASSVGAPQAEASLAMQNGALPDEGETPRQSDSPDHAAPETPDAGQSDSGTVTMPDARASGGSVARSQSAAGQGGRSPESAPQHNDPSGGANGAAGATPSTRLRMLGVRCEASSECASGHCVDGVCCENACRSACAQCRSTGECVLLDGEPDPDACSDSRQICVRGACLLPNGFACTTPYECGSGLCILGGPDTTTGSRTGRCCSMSCGNCQQCTVDGTACIRISGTDAMCAI